METTISIITLSTLAAIALAALWLIAYGNAVKYGNRAYHSLERKLNLFQGRVR